MSRMFLFNWDTAVRKWLCGLQMVVKINLGTRQSQCSACFSDEDQKANGPVV